MKIVMYGTLVCKLDETLLRKARTALEIAKFHENPPAADFAPASAAERTFLFFPRGVGRPRLQYVVSLPGADPYR